MYGRLFATAVAALALGGCAAMAPKLPDGTLNAAELRALFENRTVESVNAETQTVSITYYAPDGQARQIRKGKKRTGTWRVKSDGRVCLKMEAKRESCRIVVRGSDGVLRKYVVKLDGNHRHVVTYRGFENGNPREL